eukprot:Lithocolla_globosa_v1_NODE_2230_length_2100_cov_3667.745721.p1 type:complete len:467 gc:universal NODE_2230_length_2100_cov_3667.745721:1654-254(-)
MMLMSATSSLATTFIGWELIGVLSFLLIGFWSTRPSAIVAAVKAMCYNRVGDAAYVVALAAAVQLYGDVTWTGLCGSMPGGLVALMMAGIGVASIAKSAQLGLHAWLADAMEGPTPVSALIHAATLVTAGVLLVVRTSGLLADAPAVSITVGLVGAGSALYSAVMGTVPADVKRIIAFSTGSQVGYMVVGAVGVAVGPAVGHVVIHGFFKALLFVAAGLALHLLGDEQDARRAGGVRLPMVAIPMAVGSLSLLAVPGLSGAVTKESVLLAAVDAGGAGRFLSLLCCLGALGSGAYSLRLWLRMFGGQARGRAWVYKQRVMVSATSEVVIVVLLLGAVGLGWVFVGNELAGSVVGCAVPSLGAIAWVPLAFAGVGAGVAMFSCTCTPVPRLVAAVIARGAYDRALSVAAMTLCNVCGRVLTVLLDVGMGHAALISGPPRAMSLFRRGCAGYASGALFHQLGLIAVLG